MKFNNVRDERIGFLFILPSIIILGLVALYPISRNLISSFIDGGRFAGLRGYLAVMQDSRFRESILNTLLFCAISVPLELALGLVFALILHQKFFGRGFLRTAGLLPWALPTAVMAVGWKWIFNDTYGVFNDLLLRLHLISGPLAWLGKPGLAFFCIILAEVWKCTPFVTVILLAGLQSIPVDLYEAISVDGANAIQRFRLITLPLLRPMILTALAFRAVQAFGVFDSIWVMTGGGPAGSTEPVALYVYDTVFRYLNFNRASAAVSISFLFCLSFIFVIYMVMRRNRVEY